jgi:hypothetical protein
MYWSATVYDDGTDQKFKLKSTGGEIRVFPTSEDFDLGTFYRFYEFVCEHVDDRAEVVVDDE